MKSKNRSSRSISLISSRRYFPCVLGMERVSSFFFRPLLKIIHIGLFHLSKNSLDHLRPILIDDDNVTELLELAAKNKNLTDYEGSIHKMIDLVNSLKGKSAKNADLEFERAKARNTPSAGEVDLDEIKKKQLELKQRFAQKQKNFVQRHTNQPANQ